MDLSSRFALFLLWAKTASCLYCGDFTIGDCSFASPVAPLYKLPPGEAAFVLCQDLCRFDSLCTHFHFEFASGSCYLLPFFDSSSCQTLSGPPRPNATDCFQAGSDDTCDGIRDLDCEFTGPSLAILPGVQTAAECQAILQEGFPPGGDPDLGYFVFDQDSYVCLTYTNSERQCSGVVGPAQPDFDSACASTSQLIAGLGYDGFYQDGFEGLDLVSGERCTEPPEYVAGGKIGAVSAVLNDVMWVCGGYAAAFGADNRCFSLRADEEGQLRWEGEASMEVGRARAASAVDQQGNLLVVGGEDEYSATILDSAEILSSETLEFEPAPELTLPVPTTRLCMAAFDGGRKILLAGGSTPEEDESSASYVLDTTAPDGLFWRRVGDLRVRRRSVDCIEAGGVVLLPGGADSEGPLSTVEVFDPATETWEVSSVELPFAVSGHRLAKTSPDSDQVFLVGGALEEDGAYNDRVLRYDDGTWTEVEDVALVGGGGEDMVAEFVPKGSARLHC